MERTAPARVLTARMEGGTAKSASVRDSGHGAVREARSRLPGTGEERLGAAGKRPQGGGGEEGRVETLLGWALAYAGERAGFCGVELGVADAMVAVVRDDCQGSVQGDGDVGRLAVRADARPVAPHHIASTPMARQS
jgi:hypothetical protein